MWSLCCIPRRPILKLNPKVMTPRTWEAGEWDQCPYNTRLPPLLRGDAARGPQPEPGSGLSPEPGHTGPLILDLQPSEL